MLRGILVTGRIAGTAAGLFAAGLQHLRLIPLIAAAEVYEAAGAHADHQHGHPDSAAAEWQPAPGLERTGYTVLADVLAGIGFALLLAGGVARARLRGYPVDAPRGRVWGAPRGLVFALAPATGRPPPLPPGHAAALIGRQGA